jgi:hypothetical protein
VQSEVPTNVELAKWRIAQVATPADTAESLPAFEPSRPSSLESWARRWLLFWDGQSSDDSIQQVAIPDLKMEPAGGKPCSMACSVNSAVVRRPSFLHRRSRFTGRRHFLGESCWAAILPT